MKVIATATTIGQAFKNVGRATEIMGVFARHGFADLLHRMKLSRFLTAKATESERFKNQPIPDRLRSSFEELGPTFVKLGQLLGSRPDLIPENFVTEFQKLQDDVAKVPFPEIKAFIEAELKAPLEDVFQVFNEEPVAAASIAQVHTAILKTGQKVAVKVQRPGIDRILQNDISILRGIAMLLEKYVPESAPFNPVGLVEEFFHTILFELDFRVEANNIRKIKSNLAELEKVAVPEIYPVYSTSKVLVLELFEGVRFSDREAILKKGINPMEIIEAGADAFFHMVMHDGLFHGDLHAGNLFVLNNGKIGLIDFGIVGRLSRRVQNSIVTMFIAIIDEDYETLASEYITLCQSGGETDIALLQKDLMDSISPYVGMSLGEINAGIILLKSTSIAARHRLKVPRELMLLFKAIVTIDGLGKKLDPTFDILRLGNRLAKDVLRTRYSRERIVHDLMVLGRDLQDTLETFPRLLKRFLRTWSQNNFAIETKSKDTAELSKSIRAFSHYFVVTIGAACLIALGIAFMLLGQGPVIAGIPILPVAAIAPALWLFFTAFLRTRGHK
jgi:ubiquinone biosynthesis protein